ncbi:glycoside hydrolase family 10 protein [Shivajiella indica]|uniref:Glycoside hydrolase family 10 protein n=1 Tax=Shivajiella indica TaxID=872115 RepID=A0ABW5BDF7_9BACT
MKINFSLSAFFKCLIFGISILLILQSCKSSQSTNSDAISERIRKSGTLADGTLYVDKTYTNTSGRLDYRMFEMELPENPREFRGVWIATVANIDWPSSATDPYEKQKEDFLKLLDYYKSLNFNTVIVQIRAAGDAMYPSRFAPWSRYLTGQEGLKPQTNEDPLSWMILETHRRGMEFHAWLNPYRATMNLDTASLSPEHDFYKNRDWMVKYDTKYYYNPGLPEVREHLINIIQEVVKNYLVDGIHFDDYFYPYKVNGAKFDDEIAFEIYGMPDQKIEDWRRENVSLLIWEVSEAIKSQKPWVQFGVSPFGVWRNKDKDPLGSKTNASQTNYDDLYADVLSWMRFGWIDYLIPQIYWSMDYNLAPYRELVSWWSQNSFNTKIYVGNGPYKVRENSDTAWNDPMEIPNQLSLSKVSPNIYGNAFFSAKSMYLKNRDVADLIRQNHFRFPVLPPISIRNPVSPEPLPTPNLILHGDGYAFQFERIIKPDYRFALIYTAPTLEDLMERAENTKFQKTYLDDNDRFVIPILSPNNQKFIALSFIDKFGSETKPLVFEIQSNILK